MKALCVDDEQILLKALQIAVEKSPDIERAAAFSNGSDAISWARENDLDIAFLDIEIHKMNGIELAQKLKEIHPNLLIVFCTGYDHYARDAYKIHANGYLTKPILYTDVQEQIDSIKDLVKTAGRVAKEQTKVVVKCFGTFEIFYNGKILPIKRKRAKEILALLVDQEGRSVTVGEMAVHLFEDDWEKASKNYIYQLLFSLKSDLKEFGLGHILVNVSNGYAIEKSAVDCDYYRYLDGEEDLFKGEYMYQYSWAEKTLGKLIMNMG